jgi:hypothetical protein
VSSSSISLQIDPSEVLGVGADATLGEIREAYRAKAKRHHPDAGGEDWAFRVVSQAYQLMSVARVAHAAEREAAAPSRAYQTAAASATSNGNGRARGYANASAQRPSSHSGRRFDANESVRRGVHEATVDRTRLVDVEKLSIRYQSEGIWLITDRSNEDRFLSCCLNITWPSGDLPPPLLIESAEPILRDLGRVFETIDSQSPANSSSVSVVDNRFSGWLSFPSGKHASEAFNLLREQLHGVGLAVNQWTRDLVIPR